MARPVCPHTLDDARIDAAALWASHALRDRTVAHVELSPGDDTMYGVLVSAPALVWQDRDERQAVDYTVALRFGDTHPWGGRPDVHPSYAAKTWGRGNVCTGEVLARFLNALGEKLAAPEPHPVEGYDPHRTDCEHVLIDMSALCEGRTLLKCAHCPYEEVREADGSVVPVGEGS